MARSKDVKPTTAEYNAIKAWLITQGFKQPDLDAALGTSVSNRTRSQIAVEIVSHLKKSKKKKS